MDFIIVTDNREHILNKPRNVKIIHKTLDNIKAIASKKLRLTINIDYPYKLCDFKPAYGLFFSEYLSDYDFWGYADFDIIFGNIRTFITDELLNNYEFISVRHDVLTGYFQLFKNNEKLKTLFMQSKDYKTVFTSSKHYCFDETNFTFDEFKAGIPFSEVKSEIESMMHVIKKMEAQKEIEAYFDFHIIEGRPGRLKWDKGILTYKNVYEVMLYHLIKLKAVYHPKQQPKKIPDVFYISPTRIYS